MLAYDVDPEVRKIRVEWFESLLSLFEATYEAGANLA